MTKYKQILIIIPAIVFISGCIQEKDSLTGYTIKSPKEVIKGCLYSNGLICNQSCCATGDYCGDRYYSYKKCDVLTGLWDSTKHKNPDCTGSCVVKQIEEVENKKEIEKIGEFKEEVKEKIETKKTEEISKEKKEQQKELENCNPIECDKKDREECYGTTKWIYDYYCYSDSLCTYDLNFEYDSIDCGYVEPKEVPTCSSGWKCKDSNYRGYQYSDCSWSTLTYCDNGCSDGKCNSEPQTNEITVSYVLDGDTIKLSTGETVRLIGINAPESGRICSSEATDKLKEFVFGKQVTLERDVDDKDQYKRLLRYIYIDETFINLEMVRLGLAHKYEYGSNTEHSSKFEQAENEAKQNEGCLWKSEETNYIQDQCIYITNFHFNAVGNDNYNLNDEYVTFGNKCSYLIDMTGWTIKDETASHIYTPPSFTFQSGATFTLYTGTGTNTKFVLYWGRTPGNYAAIWNDDGDTLFLRDKEGGLVLSYSYT